MTSKLYRGQGPLMIQIQNADGSYGVIQEVGAVASASFNPQVSELQHRESYSGRRAIDAIVEVQTECSVAISVENFAIEALAVHMRSDITTGTTGSFTNAVVGAVASLAVGSIIRVPGIGIAGLTMHDSSATPVSLVLGTHYEAVSDAHGFYRILSLVGLTGNITASGTSAASKTISAISKSKIVAKVMFLGINTADNNSPLLVESLVSLQPASAFSLIDDKIGAYEIKGNCLFRNGSYFTATQLA
jgi:hypothetical protein